MTIVPSVMISVASVGEGVMIGNAEALIEGPFKSGEYVLVPSSDTTMSPTDAGTEVLKRYGSGVGEGVGKREFGRVVATVGEADARNVDIWETVSLMAVTLLREYRPTMGGSFPLMP